ncbi:DEAD/DEAH box helicase family protein (plasmid) [Methanothermococcus sp. Ax23]|uniref:hypothetical protein n=1 Tax=Methanothermococcus sp. Ax23 TaxID=3156486 RepID=UPI003BA0EA3A
MALQQATQNKIKGFIGLHQDHEETEETIKKATKIIATYDQLNKIVEIKGTDDLKDYLLVIDEYHNIITQYDLRYKAINRILDYKEAFNKVIYLSGTYEGLNIENNKIYEFKPKHQRKNNYNIIVCKNNEGLGHLMDELKRIDTSTGKYLAFINNIELIKEIEQELKGHGIDNIHILTAPNKDNPIMDNIYNEECLKEAGIYLTTSLICDGINIKDKDVKKIYIYGVNDIYQIGQYIARVRNTEPDIIHIIEPKEIKGMEPYNNYIQSIRAIIQPIIYTLNENRKEAKERGMDDKDTEVYKKIEKIPIFKEEMYIKYDIYKDQYREDIYKITKSYIDRLNIRIINNPQLIKRVLLKFYPALNITIEKIENKETIKEVAGGRTKEYLIKSIIKYGYDTIQEIKSYKGRDELKLIDKTGIQDIEELTTIKEVSKRHRDALKNIRELKEFRSFGFDINVKEKNIIKVKEKYNIKELPKELEKEIYVMAGNPKSIGKEFNILKMAKNILLDRQGLIPKGNPTLKEVWDYRIRKIILDDVLEANNNNKNINIPTILVKVREFIKENGGDDEEDKKNKQVINKDKVIEIIKEYAKITIKNETITVKKIDDRILEAYNRKVEKAKNYLEILKEHTGEQLHEEDLLELLDNNNDVLKHYIQLGYIHNIRWEYYLIDV